MYDIVNLKARALENQEILNNMYYRQLEEHDNLRQASSDLLNEERASLVDALRDMEALGAKLEYELNVLISKVEDAEDGVSRFERQVLELEERANSLEIGDVEKESWPRQVYKFLTGLA